MTAGHWLFGWLLTGTMLGVGVLHGWWGLVALGAVFGLFWWFAPDFFARQDPPEDTK